MLTEMRCLVYGSVVRRKRGDVEGVRAFDREIAEFDDTYGYAGLIAANRAWLAWRGSDYDAVERWAVAAMADWARIGRAGPTVFQWSLRFPLLAVDLERGRLESAIEHARFMLGETQQPLPADVERALRDALRAGTCDALSHAVEVARHYGYT